MSDTYPTYEQHPSGQLTPIEQAIEALTPNRVNYEIRVVWPSGEPSSYEGLDLPLDRAAERLEVLAEELRQAAGEVAS